MNKTTVGAAIAELRREKKLTAEEFAERMGISTRTVCDWESGRLLPSAEDLDVMAELFGVSADELAGGRISPEVCENGAEGRQIEREQDMVKLICRTVALAMGIAVTVLSVMGRIEPKNAVAMLGIGLTCLGIASFHRKK